MSELGYCFVMMKFNEKFKAYYKKVFSPPIKQLGLTPIRVDEIYTPTQISTDIFKLIQDSKIVLADVTEKSPNVNYELGIAHALGKRAIILTQDPSHVPFDYRHLRYITYDTSLPGWERALKSSIKNAISSTLKENSAPKVIQGPEQTAILKFLKDMQRDFSYEISKESTLQCDGNGNCRIHQTWDLIATSDITHLIYELYIDKPGTIQLQSVFDKTNSKEVSIITTDGSNKSLVSSLLLPRLLKRGERLVLDLNAFAENYLSDLFQNKKVTILHRANSRNGVSFRDKKEKFIFPLNSFTSSLKVIFHGTAQKEFSSVEKFDNTIIITVEISWERPFDGMYSYDIIAT